MSTSSGARRPDARGRHGRRSQRPVLTAIIHDRYGGAEFSGAVNDMAKEESNKELVFRLFRQQRAKGKPETVSALIAAYGKSDLLDRKIPPQEMQELQKQWRAEHPVEKDRAEAAAALEALDGPTEKPDVAAKQTKRRTAPKAMSPAAKPAAARKRKTDAPEAAPQESPVDEPKTVASPSLQAQQSSSVEELWSKLAATEIELRLVREERDWLRDALKSAVAH